MPLMPGLALCPVIYANVRQPIISTLNLAHMTPLSSVWAGLHIPGYPPTYSDNIRPFVPGYPPSFDALP